MKTQSNEINTYLDKSGKLLKRVTILVIIVLIILLSVLAISCKKDVIANKVTTMKIVHLNSKGEPCPPAICK